MSNLATLTATSNSPNIIWYQTDISVFLRIMVCDIKNYFLEVKNDRLLFSATVDGKEYYVCLYLFGTVLPERTRHRNVGSEIKITLEKSFKWLDWLRLQESKEKNIFISHDADHVQETNYEINRYRISYDYENFSEYKRLHNIDQIMPESALDDSCDSEDEIMDEILV
ncbi:prostaglandin E synthase 3-like [Prorops nasuta]|uniref:prostaglandin E synthase 3-like n=1 Tax=Prorops nasuta TaxID=863751 RepID=UPI0034CE3066